LDVFLGYYSDKPLLYNLDCSWYGSYRGRKEVPTPLENREDLE
jgi:hypothetical protein